MFGLTFSIFGGMTLATVLVFAGEMLIGKQAKKEDKDENEQNDANFGIKDESITKGGFEDTTVQLQIQDAEDGIEPIERHSLVPPPLVDSARL